MTARKPIEDHSAETRHALLEQRLESMDRKLADLSEKLDTKYAQSTELALVRLELSEIRKACVTHDQFSPVKTIVYSAVGIILTGVVVALLTLVVVTK
jgi:hypothetical protein